ncbi:Transcriptional regulatory protein BaeR [Planctomycetes bacterium Poly30]|uniref:Transcriptional regulatory protein BaeR n=1 Tax=Saltatorellus ferox TaxID=2528018 RepID=A0A518EKG4_9BACT|nr:Transcriptional regulatory protein BaeR [Planctomycetes bacterium Poly30]
MSKPSVLIVEDDPDIVELLQYTLEREGYPVLVATNGDKGLSEARRRQPGLVLLDLMMPGLSGLEVCRALKSDPGTRDIPVVMITAKSEESDVVLGLECGADDYVPKPFGPRELVARIRAVLRRGEIARPTQTRIETDGVVLDRERYEVEAGGTLLELTRSEFRLMWTLARHPGRVYAREELVERLTDGEVVILDRNIDVHVSSIRRKLGDLGDLIGTVRGVGYKWNQRASA